MPHGIPPGGLHVAAPARQHSASATSSYVAQPPCQMHSLVIGSAKLMKPASLTLLFSIATIEVIVAILQISREFPALDRIQPIMSDAPALYGQELAVLQPRRVPLFELFDWASGSGEPRGTPGTSLPSKWEDRFPRTRSLMTRLSLRASHRRVLPSEPPLRPCAPLLPRPLLAPPLL